MYFLRTSTVISILAGAGIAQAGVVDLAGGNALSQPVARQAGCQYINIEGGYCGQGNSLFCMSGKTNACSAVSKKDSFDASATSANEHACAGKGIGDTCKQRFCCTE